MNASITSSQSATDGQKKQIKRLLEDVLAKVPKVVNFDNLSNRGAQRVIAHGDELANVLIDKFRELSVSDQFANEEVESNYGYPKGYRRKDMIQQANLLRQFFSGVGFANEKLAENPLPEGAEGYFAIPRWETIAPTYHEAVEKVFALLHKQRKGNFCNYRESKLGEQYLRQTEQTKVAFQKLGDEQKGYDILVVPAQFGLRHRGRSVRRAREVMNFNEFGLGAFAVGCMLLTHPEREVEWEQLHVDCAGDECTPAGDGQFVCAPFFYFNDVKLKFNTYWFGVAYDFYGSVSGFSPQ